MARKPKATKAVAAPAAVLSDDGGTKISMSGAGDVSVATRRAVTVKASSAATVTVQCLIPGGLVLRCFTMHDDGDGGEPRAVATGMTTLVYGSNPDIDAAFMAAWLNQNADLDAVQSGLVSVLTEGNS